jgi:hypothetical protein
MAARVHLRPSARDGGGVAADHRPHVSINMLPTRRFDPIDPEDLLALEARRPHQDRTEAQVVDAELLREPLARLPSD